MAGRRGTPVRGRRDRGLIDGARLRAAMEEHGWTATSFARRLSEDLPEGQYERPQTIHNLIEDDRTKQCERDRLDRIARALSVSTDWLAGAEAVFPLPGYLPVSAESNASPRVSVALSRLLQRCHEACERDFTTETSKTTRKRSHAASERAYRAKQNVQWFVLSAIGHLLSPRIWRYRLTGSQSTEPDGSAEEVDGPTSRLRLSPEQERAALGLVRAFEYALEPWLSGRTDLDLRSFHQFATAINPMVGAVKPDDYQPGLPRHPSAAEVAQRLLTNPNKPIRHPSRKKTGKTSAMAKKRKGS